MRILDPTPPRMRGTSQLGGALSCLALAASAYAAAPPAVLAPANGDPDAIVVSNGPQKLPKKHREIKPGPVKPQAYPSKPQPLLETPNQNRSPS